MKNLETKISLEHLSERRKHILFDEYCPDVTEKELKTFISRLKGSGYYKEADTLIERYKNILHYPSYLTKAANDYIHRKVENGETPIAVISTQLSNCHASPHMEKMLEQKDEKASTRSIIGTSSMIKRKGLVDEFNKFNEMYSDVFESRNKHLLDEVLGISDKVERSSIDKSTTNSHSINGSDPGIWKMLNDPGYIPHKTAIWRGIHKLERQNRYEEVKFVLEKYQNYISFRDPEKEEKKTCVWKLLNDPHYFPKVGVIKRYINLLKKQGCREEVDFLLEKYDDILHPCKWKLRSDPEEALNFANSLRLLNDPKHYEFHHNGKVYHISEDGELLDDFTAMK